MTEKPTYEELEQRIKELESSKRDSDNLLNSLFPTYSVDQGLNYVNGNERFLSTIGASTIGELTGKNYADNHTPEDLAEFSEKVKGVFETGEPHSYRYSKDEIYRKLEPVKNASGEIIAVSVQEIDVKPLLSNDLLPICANCKNIREEEGPNKGKWVSIEKYIKDRYGLDFSHGICPECAGKLYPEFYKPK